MIIFETCECCDGEGRVYAPGTLFPAAWATCTPCNGTGEVEVENYPLELEDFEECFGC